MADEDDVPWWNELVAEYFQSIDLVAYAVACEDTQLGCGDEEVVIVPIVHSHRLVTTKIRCAKLVCNCFCVHVPTVGNAMGLRTCSSQNAWNGPM